jgi:hypothetical protein
MNERMPRSMIWASPGGIAPKEKVVKDDIITSSLYETDQVRDITKAEKETWVEGAGQEDNQRYRKFLAYCEEKREEAQKMKEGDEERKR